MESERLSESGFLSQEFQRWHASTIEALRVHCGEGHDIYRSFAALQFEWPLETLAHFARIFESETASPFPFEVEQVKRFEKALGEAREILTTAIVSLKDG
jgi:hypothetical protein